VWRVTAFDREGREVASLEAEHGEVTIGRETDRQLILPAASVSRRHARLLFGGPQPMIVDEGSANGVVVNGARIAAPTPVGPGVRIDLAEFTLVVAPAPRTETVPPIEGPPEDPAASWSDGSDAPLQSIRLVAEGGVWNGRMFELTGAQVSVGRAVDNDLVFDDPSLSRKHAVLRQLGNNRVDVEDLKSSNGTFVNDRRIDRATAAVGDALRFGEVQFRIEGETAIQSIAPRPRSSSSPRQELLVWGGAGVLALGLAFGVTVLFVRSRSSSPEGKEAIAKIAEQAAAHVKTGKDRLADRAFAAAEAEFQQALELDPADGEARRLKTLAASEPQNERLAQQIRIRAKLAVDRAALGNVVPMLLQLPSESTFHEPTARELATRLITFGETQCKSKRFADCAWSICKAREIAPPSARSVVAAAAAETALKEAEKKLARDRSYVPCKLR
jgi:pSer/pThr/pTyr-binding forkhead associated (FHA) protein